MKRQLNGKEKALLLQRILTQFPGPTFGSSQTPVIIAPGNPKPSSDLHGHLHQHICIPIDRFKHMWFNKVHLKKIFK